MEAVAVIPARFQSSRFPGKPLVHILGVPLVVRVYQRTVQVIPKSYVATDDIRIQTVCLEYGIPVIMTSSNHSTGTDRVCEAVKELPGELFVNVQGDEPLVEPEDIQAIVETKKKFFGEVINGMCPLRSEEEWKSRDVPKVTCSQDKKLLYMTRGPIPMSKEGSYEGGMKQVCIYAFTRGELELFHKTPKQGLEQIEDIEILRFLENDYPVRMVKMTGNTIAVDRPEDVRKVELALGGV